MFFSSQPVIHHLAVYLFVNFAGFPVDRASSSEISLFSPAYEWCQGRRGGCCEWKRALLPRVLGGEFDEFFATLVSGEC